VTERSVANPVAGATALGVGILAAILAVVLAFSVFAKPSGAQGVQITVEPTTVGFGALEVTANPETRTITIRNTGTTDVEIGGASTTITGPDAGDFDLLSEVLDTLTGDPLLDPDTGLPADLSAGVTVGAGDAVDLQVNFDASAEGTRDAVLELTDTADTLIQEINLTGTGTANDPNLQPGAQQDCTVTGTNNGETLTGTSGDDIICALGGRDRVNGLGGSDTIRGGGGNDRLVDPSANPNPTSTSSTEADRLNGETGKDRINSRDGAGDDVVNGGPGRDRIKKDKGDQGRRR
jgi:Ca2+-binding RTX toxin-like protein